jgi:hypothetical protein
MMAVRDEAGTPLEEASILLDSFRVGDPVEAVAVAVGVLMLDQYGAGSYVRGKQGIEAAIVVAEEQDGF